MNQFTVFTKPWKMPLPELGRFVSQLGFDGVELPVRPGYQVEPENVEAGLPEAVRVLGDQGVKISSIAGPTDERTIGACAAAGVPVIRICVSIPAGTRYFAAVAEFQRQWEQLLPALERHGVTLGIQNHFGRDISSAMQLHHAISQFDPRRVAAVWDPAHCALGGEIPELALDILEGRLCIVNLKNAIYRKQAGPESEPARWQVYWTSGRQGLANWGKVAKLLTQAGWQGNVCLTAEYSDHDAVDRLIAEDIRYAKQCFVEAVHGRSE
jgi:sugar phosphate isomerase/epimerase